jgi:23S rRNA (guanosine2251-2'-O)-methyltransferase
MLIIGRNPLIEALKFNSLSIKKIVLLNNLSDNKIKEIISKAEEKNILVEKLNKENFEKYFDKKNKSEGISQGVIAEVIDFEYADFDEALKDIKNKEYITVVMLDEIQDPHNLWAIIRTSAAAGVDLITLTEKNTAKVNHTVIKSSSGATNYIKISQIRSVYDTIDELKSSGLTIIGTSLNSQISHFVYKFDPKTVLIFGNEGLGLRKNILNKCDSLIKIPLKNKKIDSLNVSVSAGILLYEILRQRKTFEKDI